ncbi:hypothetical protein MXMO3_01902 [Maritalea myrionectae]|uniref:Uncharacterized protein n=1 Tax=Maritalea myrionectae TaxID=454601 RepID=A0A2R4MEW2_9HYPH|nr:hypothetical protein MXMO3_01902 [Maritalea myrionectae]
MHQKLSFDVVKFSSNLVKLYLMYTDMTSQAVKLLRPGA